MLSVFKKIVVRVRRSGLVSRIYKFAFLLAGKLPVKKNLIMFESFSGKQYSDNPRAIYEYMVDNDFQSEYELLWSIDKRSLDKFKGQDLQLVKRFSLKWLLSMARARYWIVNSRLPLWIPKPKHTSYLQTWHGTPLKKLGADINEVHMPGTTTEKYRLNFLHEAKKWDYLVSPNAYSTNIFRRAFGFNNIILEVGYPRNDFLIKHNNTQDIQSIKERLKLPKDKKIILYAPTWRDNDFYERGKYKFQLNMDLEKMKKEIGDEYIILLRMHYLVAENLELEHFKGFVYDFSNYQDIRELYLISDMLITDYSSVFFDYGILKRPILFFVYDLDEYRDTLRGFYFDLESEAPGVLVKDTESIIKEILNIQRNNFKVDSSFENFYNKFCYLESGNSSRQVVDQIITESE